jgi:hypothetical protein
VGVQLNQISPFDPIYNNTPQQSILINNKPTLISRHNPHESKTLLIPHPSNIPIKSLLDQRNIHTAVNKQISSHPFQSKPQTMLTQQTLLQEKSNHHMSYPITLATMTLSILFGNLWHPKDVGLCLPTPTSPLRLKLERSV